MLQEELTESLRHLANELDELAEEANAPMPPFPDIPGFEPVAFLGCGGMGAVYIARQTSLGRNVAVKTIRADGIGKTAPLNDEAKTVARLHHPNIVQIFSAGGDVSSAWFAMELVKGDSADIHAFASIEEIAGTGIAVAEALAYAHRCGMLHRDVKPSNIFIGENGTVKLGDFGLACLTEAVPADRSGTEKYLAPEVSSGGKPSEASDQYSLGKTLSELSKRIAHGSSEQSADFDAICAKAANAEPSHRYKNVEALLSDLRRFIAHEPVAANPPSTARRFRLFARRNPLAAFGVAATIVLSVAFAAALFIGYMKTAQALVEAQNARAQTEKALKLTEKEAASAAQALVFALTKIDRSQTDKRNAELQRASECIRSLQERFPSNETIRASQGRLKYAIEAHQRLKKRNDGNSRIPHRFRSKPVSR